MVTEHISDALGPQTGPMRASSFDATMVQRAVVGDHDALGAIFREGRPRLIAYYRFHGLPSAAAEDVASDAMERVLRNVSSLRKPASFDAWFWRIARSQRVAWYRKGNSPSELPAPEPEGPAEQVERNEEYRHIRLALERISERDRDLLWLREVEGLTYGEIGGRLGAAVGSVRVACHRARQRLGEAYEGIAH